MGDLGKSEQETCNLGEEGRGGKWRGGKRKRGEKEGNMARAGFTALVMTLIQME